MCVGLLVLAACGSDPKKAASPGATVPTLPPQTTTTNPYAVPAVIDVAYVNRVLAGLDAAQGDLTRLVVNAKTITPEAIDRMKALYATPQRIQNDIDLFQDDMRAGFSNYLPHLGDVKTMATQLITARPSCIYVKVDRDYSAVSRSPDPRYRAQWIALRSIASVNLTYNPTAWSLLYDGFESNFQAPSADPCTGI